MIVSPARHTIFLILNWPMHYEMTLSKCLPKIKNVKKTPASGQNVTTDPRIGNLQGDVVIAGSFPHFKANIFQNRLNFAGRGIKVLAGPIAHPA